MRYEKRFGKDKQSLTLTINMKNDLVKIKELRGKTGISIGECRAALEKANGDIKKAVEFLKQRGVEIAEKKSTRAVGAGLVETYVHAGRVGAMVEIACETDFVARTDDFKNLVREIAMQVASMNPENVEDLEKQDYIRDSSLTIGDLVKNTIAKVGENIVVKRFTRFALGEA